MARGNQQNRWTLGAWREPREPEAQNIVIDVADPDFLSDATKRRILASAAVVLVVVAVSLGVALSQGGGSSDRPPEVNETVGGNETKAAPVNPPPTRSPTGPSDAAATTVTERFMSALPQYSLELASANASSPQAKALAWLQNDPMYNEYELHRLFQRYALAVLYLSTGGDSWTTATGWLSNANECSWYHFYNYNSICEESFRFTILNLANNALDGPLPTEVVLLSDLKYMVFNDKSLAVAFTPELYVS
jgi:hypothetical protein